MSITGFLLLPEECLSVGSPVEDSVPPMLDVASCFAFHGGNEVPFLVQRVVKVAVFYSERNVVNYVFAVRDCFVFQ